jgi:hypothetical protein
LHMTAKLVTSGSCSTGTTQSAEQAPLHY